MKRQKLDDPTRFALTAVLGTVAIVAIAPFVRPHVLPAWLDGPSRGLRSHPAIARAADRLAHALLWQPPRQSPARAAGAATPKSTANSRRWGVTSGDNVPVYRVNGDFFQRCPSGTTVLIIDTRDSTAGLVYRCQLPPPHSGQGEFLVPAASLNVYEGDLNALPAERVELYRRHARLQAELQLARRPSNGDIRKDNPHLREYQAAKSASDSFAATVRDLQSHFDKATGDERMRYGDELRRLRGEAVDRGRTLDAARARYEEWNASHPAPDNMRATEVARLESELAAVAAQMGQSTGIP